MYIYTVFEHGREIRTKGGYDTKEAAILAAETSLRDHGGTSAEVFRRLPQ